MTLIGAVILSGLIAIVLFGSKRIAVLSISAGILFLTQGLSIDFFGINLYAMRILVLFGMLRIVFRKEFNISFANPIDRYFIILYSIIVSVSILRYTNESTYQIAAAADATCSYFVFRALISDLEDMKWLLNRLAILLVPFFGAVLVERVTLQNPFVLVGANLYIADFREGIPRCTGSFRHAILMGSFAAAFLPLYIGFSLNSHGNLKAKMGAAICVGIVFLSNSGGPLSSAVIGILGWGFWKFRERMRSVRILLVIMIAVLTVIMKAPIWALPAKISNLTGGGGWHRYYLVEMAIQSLSDWWLAGMSIEKTKDWFPYIVQTGGADITNEFISFGLSAGILAVIFLVVLLTKSFKAVGEQLAVTRSIESEKSDEFLIWGIGVTLLVHISNWFGVSYFDQIKFVWYLHVSMVAMLADKAREYDSGSNIAPIIAKSEA
jgi:hypothetical protein